MKKSLQLIVVIILIGYNSNAQSFRFGTIAADAGVGFGIYGIRAYSPINKTEAIGIGIIGTLPTVNAELGLMRFLGVGIHYRRGTYGKNSSGVIRGSDIALMINFHVANKKDKFDLPIGVGYGYSSMNADLTGSQHLYAKGSVIRVHVSPHIYFTKNIGMFFRVAYNKHLLNNNIELQDSNGTTYTEADGATWNMGGLEFNFGVAFKIGLLGNKEESK